MAVLTEIVKVATRSASAASSGVGSGAAAELIGAICNRGPVPRALTEFPAPSSFKEASGSFFKTASASRLLIEAPGRFLTAESHGASFMGFKEASSSFFKAAPAGAPGNVCKHAPSGALPRPRLVDPGSFCKHLDRPSSFWAGHASILPTLRTSRGRMNCHHISRRCLSNDHFFPGSLSKLSAKDRLAAERIAVDGLVLATIESWKAVGEVPKSDSVPGSLASLRDDIFEKVMDYIAKVVALFLANMFVAYKFLTTRRTPEKDQVLGRFWEFFGYPPVPPVDAPCQESPQHLIVVVGKASTSGTATTAGKDSAIATLTKKDA